MNISKELSKVKNMVISEIEGGLFEPVAGERLMSISRLVQKIAINVFATDISSALPTKIHSIEWTGWYGEADNGVPGKYVDSINLVFMVGGVAYSLPVYRDFFDFDSADLSLIAYLADITVSNIDDAEKALLCLNHDSEKIFDIDPARIEDFCLSAFEHSNIEEWKF